MKLLVFLGMLLLEFWILSQSASAQCYVRSWAEPGMVNPTSLRRDEPPYRLVTTADDSLRVVWAEGHAGTRIYHLHWSAYLDPGWSKPKPIFGIDGSYTENFPHLSRGDDGSIAMTYVRAPAGSSEGELMLSMLYPDSLVWSLPLVIRSPVAWGMNPVVANVTADSLWVFFNRGVRLRAKQVRKGIPGDEYIFDNMDGGTYAWTPDVVRTADGTIWVFWAPNYSEQPLFRLHRLRLGSGGFVGPAYVDSSADGSDVDAIEFEPNRIWLAYNAESPVPPGSGASELKTRFWDGERWGEEYWIAGDEGYKRNCLFGRFGVDGNGRLVLVYNCEAEGEGGLQWDLYSTSWQGSSWCPSERLNLPDLDQYWYRTFPTVGFGERGQLVVVYGYGPLAPYFLSSTEILRTVSVLRAQIELRKLAGGRIEVIVSGDLRGPLWMLSLFGYDGTHNQWARAASLPTSEAQEVYTVVRDERYSAYRAILMNLETGEQAAESNVIRWDSSSSVNPITWSNVGYRAIQFCRNSTDELPKLMGVIYDQAGRRVANFDSFLDTSLRCAEWRGVDSEGRPVAAGVYMVRFTQQERANSTPHVIRVVVMP